MFEQIISLINNPAWLLAWDSKNIRLNTVGRQCVFSDTILGQRGGEPFYMMTKIKDYISNLK